MVGQNWWNLKGFFFFFFQSKDLKHGTKGKTPLLTKQEQKCWKLVRLFKNIKKRNWKTKLNMYPCFIFTNMERKDPKTEKIEVNGSRFFGILQPIPSGNVSIDKVTKMQWKLYKRERVKIYCCFPPPNGWINQVVLSDYGWKPFWYDTKWWLISWKSNRKEGAEIFPRHSNSSINLLFSTFPTSS